MGRDCLLYLGGSDDDYSSNCKSAGRNPCTMVIKYQPLNRLKAETRVITILPREHGTLSVPIVNTDGFVQPDVVCCQIKHVSLRDPKALSPLSQLNWTRDSETSTKASNLH
jgi:hypothetical protein